MKKFLSANEAVAHAAAQAGCVVASAYPGTPSTEILENIAKFKDTIRCEWAVNEKVAVETAVGASMAGARAITAMKHVGLNVAMDPLMTFTYVGPLGGFVLVSADDPGMHSSQNEQDNRNLAKFARALLLEPADSQEAYDFTLKAFELSEKFQVPVILRLTTRTSHSASLVELGDFKPAPHPLIPYKKNIAKNIPVPMFARQHRVNAQKRTEAMEKEANRSKFNKVVKPAKGVKVSAKAKGLGIITSAVAYQYVREIFPDCQILKLGWTNPLPKALVTKFAKSVKKLLVVEELDPFLEEQIKAMGLKVLAHKTELNMHELNADRVQNLRHEILGDVPKAKVAKPAEGLPTRPPVLCAGCGHRGVFYVLHKLGATVTGDIGCYTLGAFPPLDAMDSTDGLDDLHGRVDRQRGWHAQGGSQGAHLRRSRRLDVLPQRHHGDSLRALQRNARHDCRSRQPHHCDDWSSGQPWHRQDPRGRSRACNRNRRHCEGLRLQERRKGLG